jgi:hypothetical protein
VISAARTASATLTPTDYASTQNFGCRSSLLAGFVGGDNGGVVRNAELQSQGFIYLRPSAALRCNPAAVGRELFWGDDRLEDAIIGIDTVACGF